MIRLAKATWYVLTLRCEEADRIRCRISSGADAPWHQRFGERVHSTLCRSCRSARRKLDAISSVIASDRDRLAAGAGESLSDAGRQAIAERLRAEQGKNSRIS